jgi:hypothetical protein
MLIAGVDLAAEPKGTALAIIDWSPDQARLVELKLGIDDAQIVAAAPTLTKLGIDCALGWPLEFIEFLNGQNRQVDEASGPTFDSLINPPNS